MKTCAHLLLAGAALGAPQDAPEPLPTEEFAACSAAVKRFAVDVKGQRVVVATDDGKLHLWDYRKRERVWETRWSPDGSLPLAGLDIGEETVTFAFLSPAVTELDAETGEQTHSVGGPRIRSKATGMVGDPRDRWAWVATDDGFLVRLVPKNVNGWSQRAMGNEGVTCIARDPKGNLIAVAGVDRTIRFVNAKSANPDDKKVFEGHAAAISALAFDARGATLVSGAEDGELRVWKVSSGKSEPLTAHAAAVRSLACGPKGRWLASGDQDGVVILWDLKKSVRVAALAGEGGARGLAFLDGGKTLAWADGAAHLKLVDLSGL